MARRGSTEEIKVAYVAAIATPAAPKVTELTAGIDLTPFLRRDGLSTPQSGSTVDASDLSSRQNKTAAGSYGAGPVEIRAFRDDTPASDTAYSTLAPGTEGFLAIRRFGGSDVAFAAAQKVEIWPVEVISRAMADVADNDNQSFTVSLAVPGEIFEDVAVVAGP